MNCHPLIPCSTTCHTHRPMSSVTVGMPRINSVNISGTGDYRPVIPPRKNDPEVVCPKWADRHRHLVENLWARLKEWRTVATRYEKTAASFLSVIFIAATADYIKA